MNLPFFLILIYNLNIFIQHFYVVNNIKCFFNLKNYPLDFVYNVSLELKFTGKAKNTVFTRFYYKPLFYQSHKKDERTISDDVGRKIFVDLI